MAGSSTTPPTGNGSRARNRSGASRQTSWIVVRSCSRIKVARVVEGVLEALEALTVARREDEVFRARERDRRRQRGIELVRAPAEQRQRAGHQRSGPGSRTQVAIEVSVARTDPSWSVSVVTVTGPPFVARTIAPAPRPRSARATPLAIVAWPAERDLGQRAEVPDAEPPATPEPSGARNAVSE